METANITNKASANTSKEKIDALISIGAGRIVENALNKVIHFQLARYRNNISQINDELARFEKNYKMSSEQFYKKFEAGKLGDGEDFFEWSSLYENILLYKQRIKELESLGTE